MICYHNTFVGKGSISHDANNWYMAEAFQGTGMIYCGFAWPRLLERIWAASLFCEHSQSLGFAKVVKLIWQHVML